MEVVVLYVKEQHPSGKHRQPRTLDERRELAEAYVDDHDVEVPVLIDEMDDGTRAAFGDRPNMAFVLDANGVVRYKEQWESPEALTDVLQHLLDSMD